MSLQYSALETLHFVLKARWRIYICVHESRQFSLLLLQVRQSLLRQAHQPAARRWTAKTREMKKAEAEAEPVGLAAADRSLLAAIAKAQVSQVLRHHEVAARAKV